MDQLTYYATRAQAAYAAAEAATDPRDKAAFKGAAQTWERLSRPVASTYSLEPERRDLAALKKDAAVPIDPPCAPEEPAPTTLRPRNTFSRLFQAANAPRVTTTIEF